MTKILVTGATGFTGSHLARRLVGDSHDVRALVRDTDRASPLRDLGITLIRGDLVDTGSLLRATEGVDLVYHIAATYRDQGIDPKVFWDTNAEGTRRLLKASVQNKVGRFVHCSTVGVHGHIENVPANESAPYAPGDIYQESKLEGEKIAIEYQRNGEISVIIFRPTGIYGPGDTRFLKMFQAIKRRHFAMLGSGKTYYHFTYIDDLIDGIILCGTKDEAIGNIYILGGDTYQALNEVAVLIAEELNVPTPKLHLPFWPVYFAGFFCEVLCRPFGIKPPLYRRRVDFFRKCRAFDISKAKTELGFRPTTDLRKGFHLTAQWYKESHYL